MFRLVAGIDGDLTRSARSKPRSSFRHPQRANPVQPLGTDEDMGMTPTCAGVIPARPGRQLCGWRPLPFGWEPAAGFASICHKRIVTDGCTPGITHSGHCLTTSDHPIRTGRSRTSVSRSRPSRVNGGLDRRRQAEPLIICGRRPAVPWLPRIRHRHRQTTSLTRSDQRCLDLDSQKDHCWIIVGVLVAGIGAPLAGFRGLLDLLPTP